MEHSESFEKPNSGCRQEEPEDAGPGVMDKILVSFIHMKEKRAHLTKSNPSTPTGIRTQAEQLEHNMELLTHSPHSPHSFSSDSGTEINAKEGPDQHHNEALGNGGEPSPSESSSTGSAPFVQVSASPRGSGRSLRDHGTSPSSHDIPPKDLGEKFMGLLPGSHTNPYAVPQHTTTAAEVNNHSAGPASPAVQRSSTPSSPSILGRLKTERLIIKLADKLHLHSPRSATEDPGTPRATTTSSPTANSANSPTVTTTTATSTPSANTGAPALATDTPTTTMATATGPTEN